MDKYFDGDTWCHSNTCNIKNEFNLNFRAACCVGHMCCGNSDCKYLTQEQRHNFVSEKLWDGYAKKYFSGHAPSVAILVSSP